MKNRFYISSSSGKQKEIITMGKFNLIKAIQLIKDGKHPSYKPTDDILADLEEQLREISKLPMLNMNDLVALPRQNFPTTKKTLQDSVINEMINEKQKNINERKKPKGKVKGFFFE